MAYEERMRLYRVTFVKLGSVEHRVMGKEKMERVWEDSGNVLGIPKKIIGKFECDFPLGYSPFENIREILRCRSFDGCLFLDHSSFTFLSFLGRYYYKTDTMLQVHELHHLKIVLNVHTFL